MTDEPALHREEGKSDQGHDQGDGLEGGEVTQPGDSTLEGREPEPRLFMLDLMLPAMSGIELAQRLRTDGYRETPIIAMSASPTMLQVAEESELFHGSLGMPFELDGLLEAVECYLGRN